MPTILPVSGSVDRRHVAGLMRRYAEETGVDACFKTLDAELANPSSAFQAALLARIDGRAVGCVALKTLDESRAELVRLYVDPEHRRDGIGRTLVESALEAACQAGFDRVVLHTLARWQAAATLYRRLGFTPAEPYCDVPLDNVLFFEREIKSKNWPAP